MGDAHHGGANIDAKHTNTEFGESNCSTSRAAPEIKHARIVGNVFEDKNLFGGPETDGRIAGDNTGVLVAAPDQVPDRGFPLAQARRSSAQKTGRFQDFFESPEEAGGQRTVDDAMIGGEIEGQLELGGESAVG